MDGGLRSLTNGIAAALAPVASMRERSGAAWGTNEEMGP